MFLLLPSIAGAAPKYRAATIAIDRTHRLTVASSKGTVIRLGTSSGPRLLGICDRGYRFVVGSKKKPRATVYVTVRSLPTTSQVVFTRLESPKQAVPVTVTFVGPGESYSKTVLGMKANLTRSVHTGVDRTSGPYGWITLSSRGALDRSVFLSKAYRFRLLTHKYRRGGTSYVKSLVSESNLVSVRKLPGSTIGVSVGLAANKDSCERYFIVSPRNIVETDTPVSLVASITATEWRWLDPTGSYIKVGSSEPYSSRGYGRGLATMRANSTLRSYTRSGAALFENLLLNDAYSLTLIRSSDGLWRTNYTSMWVKSESGIVAPYVDTCHNDVFAGLGPLFANALAAHGVTTADGIREWSSPFATFLAGRAATGNVISTERGYYFADYYDASGLAKVHASLNHNLGEMCYLMGQSGDTSATVAFQVAMNIKAAIDDSGTTWIAPNDNMYYQRDLAGKYSGLESPGLSYDGLLAGQMYFQKFLGETDPVFDQLIASKKRRLGITALDRDLPVNLLPPNTGSVPTEDPKDPAL